LSAPGDGSGQANVGALELKTRKLKVIDRKIQKAKGKVMTARHTGSCLCGAVRFEVDEFQDQIAHCHCSMCRKFHGAAFATIAGVERSKFRWIRGEDALRGYTAGNGTTRSFCSQCGSSIAFSSPRAPADVVEIALGLIDGEIDVTPDAHIFVGSKANWCEITDDLPAYIERRNSEKIG